MADRLDRIDRRIIYASLLIIIVLAAVTRLSPEETYSIVSVFLIIIVALGNIGYLYSRSRRRSE
jgi:lipoprotein signal peptidase